jgi:hypothetical protein
MGVPVNARAGRTLNATAYIQIEWMTASQRDAIAAPMFHAWLGPLGLTQITPRRWIDGSKPPVRRLFELGVGKTGDISLRWGFSLDFVPHVSGDSVRWHRSDKSAMLDIFIDPKKMPTIWCPRAEQFRDEFPILLSKAVAAAKKDWKRGSTYEGVLQILREIRKRNTNWLTYEMYPQGRLAYAFLTAKTGKLKLAEKELDRCVAHGWLKDSPAAKLKKLLRETAERS